jgi:hypothetical protein
MRAPMAAARWRRAAAAAAAVLVLVMGAGLPAGCAAQEGEEVVVASYGQGRLWLKPYDWTYLRGETVRAL